MIETVSVPRALVRLRFIAGVLLVVALGMASMELLDSGRPSGFDAWMSRWQFSSNTSSTAHHPKLPGSIKEFSNRLGPAEGTPK